MRGKRRDDVSQLIGMGITPAHAGKTDPEKQSVPRKGDHPRACGENPVQSLKIFASKGSPPRMRGKLTGSQHSLHRTGITPAHAGKTVRTARPSTRRRDHPRACGENPLASRKAMLKEGSPPRMRGKRSTTFPRAMCTGITPAHAGKTSCFPRTPRPDRDHPRACGENAICLPGTKPPVGSPPRMRGKHDLLLLLRTHVGITPAHAGKTKRKPKLFGLSGDHPRACGENTPVSISVKLEAGSPPRMRGKQSDLFHLFHPLGITPAHAGKTLRKGRISVVDPSPQPQSSLTSRRADASSGSQRAPCAAPV